MPIPQPSQQAYSSWEDEQRQQQDAASYDGPTSLPQTSGPDLGGDARPSPIPNVGPDDQYSRQPIPNVDPNQPQITPTMGDPISVPAAGPTMGAPISVPSAAPPAQQSGTWAFPVQGYQGQVEPHWGQERGGADLFAPAGTPVVAAQGGRVLEAGYSSIGGNNVLIQGDDGNQYYYAHLQNTPLVRPGQTVPTGAQLGGVGNTGNASTGPTHLHFGAGPSIINGGGPTGGVGANFDTTSHLQAALSGQPAPTQAPSAAPTGGNSYQDYARQAAQRAGIDPELFVRQLSVENPRWDPSAVSPAGARGIPQIVPSAHPNAPVNDPYGSIDYAANLMASHLRQYGGDYPTALAAYNAGPGNVAKYGGVPPFQETQGYIAKIMGGQPLPTPPSTGGGYSGPSVAPADLTPYTPSPMQAQLSASVAPYRDRLAAWSGREGGYQAPQSFTPPNSTADLQGLRMGPPISVPSMPPITQSFSPSPATPDSTPAPAPSQPALGATAYGLQNDPTLGQSSYDQPTSVSGPPSDFSGPQTFSPAPSPNGLYSDAIPPPSARPDTRPLPDRIAQGAGDFLGTLGRAGFGMQPDQTPEQHAAEQADIAARWNQPPTNALQVAQQAPNVLTAGAPGQTQQNVYGEMTSSGRRAVEEIPGVHDWDVQHRGPLGLTPLDVAEGVVNLLLPGPEALGGGVAATLDARILARRSVAKQAAQDAYEASVRQTNDLQQATDAAFTAARRAYQDDVARANAGWAQDLGAQGRRPIELIPPQEPGPWAPPRPGGYNEPVRSLPPGPPPANSYLDQLTGDVAGSQRSLPAPEGVTALPGARPAPLDQPIPMGAAPRGWTPDVMEQGGRPTFPALPEGNPQRVRLEDAARSLEQQAEHAANLGDTNQELTLRRQAAAARGAAAATGDGSGALPAQAAASYAVHLGGAAAGALGSQAGTDENTTPQERLARGVAGAALGAVASHAVLAGGSLARRAWTETTPQVMSAINEMIAPARNTTPEVQTALRDFSGRRLQASVDADTLALRIRAALGKENTMAAAQRFEQTGQFVAKPTPEQAQLAQDLERFVNQTGDLGRANGYITGDVRGGAAGRYFPHVYQDALDQATTGARKSGLSPKDFYSNARVYPTLSEAVAAGRQPVDSVSSPVRLYAEHVADSEAKFQLVQQLKSATPAAAVNYTGAAGEKLPRGWVPGLAIAPQFSGVAFAPEVAKAVKNIIQPSGLRSTMLGRGILDTMGSAKESLFSLSGFHLVTELRQAYRARGASGVPAMGQAIWHTVNPAAFDKFRVQNADTFSQAARAGVTGLSGFVPETDQVLGGARGALVRGAVTGTASGVGEYQASKNNGEDDQTALLHGLIAGGIGMTLGATVAKPISDGLWDRLVPTLKATTYQALTQGRKASPQEAATLVNQTYGGQNLAAIARSKTVQDALRAAFLAPDWWEGWGRSLAGALQPGSLGNQQRAYWVRTAVVDGAVGLEGMNLALSGHLTNENEPGHQFDLELTGLYDRNGWQHTDQFGYPYRVYTDVLGPIRSILEAPTDPGRFLEGRLSQPIGTALDMVRNVDPSTGKQIVKDGTPWPQALPQEAGHAISQGTPIGGQTLGQSKPNTRIEAIPQAVGAVTGLRSMFGSVSADHRALAQSYQSQLVDALHQSDEWRGAPTGGQAELEKKYRAIGTKLATTEVFGTKEHPQTLLDKLTADPAFAALPRAERDEQLHDFQDLINGMRVEDQAQRTQEMHTALQEIISDLRTPETSGRR